MNRLVLSTEKYVAENINILEIKGENVILHIAKTVEIGQILFPDFSFHITFDLQDQSQLLYFCSQIFQNVNGKIDIVSHNTTRLIFHLGIVSQKDNSLEICNQVVGNANQSEIKIRVLSYEYSKIYLKATGIIEANTKDNQYLEDIKYLNEFPGTIICLPELLVESDDAKASHNMSVACIDEETLFYLNSKGIENDIAQKMIRKSFIECMNKKER